MNEKVNIWKKLLGRVAVFFMLLSMIFAGCPGGMPTKAYAYNDNDPMTYGPFKVVLSETQKTVRKVKAEVSIIDVRNYRDLTSRYDVSYYWDSVKGAKSTHEGTEYYINSPGKHTLYIYIPRENCDPMYGRISFEISNIDNNAPRMGSIKSKVTEGKWDISIEGCSDDKTAAEKLKYLCLKESQAASYRPNGVLNEDSINAASGWSSGTNFLLDEGSYSVFARDEAGNVGERSFDTGHIDIEPPFFKSEPELFPEGEVNGFARAVLISVDADDEGDGLCEYPYSFNGGETWQQGNEMRVVENGTVNILIKDSMGNISEGKTVEITNIDNDAPSLKVSEGSTPSDDGSIVINVSASDERSGVTEISYQNDEVGIPVIVAGGDGNGNGSLQTSVTINSNGAYTFSAKDVMGNSRSERINVVKAIKTEYRDVTKDKDTDKKKDKDKDKDKKDKDKNKDKNKSDKETKIINPGGGSGGGSSNGGSGGSNGYSGYNGNDDGKKIIIKDSGSSQTADETKTGSGKTGSSAGTAGSTIVSGNKGGTGTNDKGLRAGSGKIAVTDLDEEQNESDDDDDKDESSTESTEIREVTLDEYLAAAPENEAVEEEIIPELMDKDAENEGKKKSKAGVAVMVILILLVLTGLTLFLLIKKGIISLPEESGEEDDESDEETGILGFADRIASCFKKNLT